MRTVQVGLRPLHDPLQPAKRAPRAGRARRDATSPSSNRRVHDRMQRLPGWRRSRFRASLPRGLASAGSRADREQRRSPARTRSRLAWSERGRHPRRARSTRTEGPAVGRSPRAARIAPPRRLRRARAGATSPGDRVNQNRYSSKSTRCCHGRGSQPTVTAGMYGRSVRAAMRSHIARAAFASALNGCSPVGHSRERGIRELRHRIPALAAKRLREVLVVEVVRREPAGHDEHARQPACPRHLTQLVERGVDVRVAPASLPNGSPPCCSKNEFPSRTKRTGLPATRT